MLLSLSGRPISSTVAVGPHLAQKQLVAQLVSAEWWRRLCPQSFDYLLKRLKEVDSSWLRSTACGTPPRCPGDDGLRDLCQTGEKL